MTKATTMRATKSAGERLTAKRASRGANSVSSAVAIVPAMNEPMAAVARAAAPRPSLAILLPSMAVMTDADSPGVFNRMLVVEPPYIPP